MRRVARTQATIDASHVYEHLSKHRSKARTERTGSNKPRVPPRSSFHYSLDYDVKLHSPTQKHPRGALGTAGAGGVRGDAPSPNALVTRPAPSTPPNLVKAELRAIRARRHTSDDARTASTQMPRQLLPTKFRVRARSRVPPPRPLRIAAAAAAVAAAGPLPRQPQPNTPSRLVDLDDGHVNARPYFNPIR